MTVIVLPPLAQSLEDEIRVQVRHLDPEAIVTCSETAEAGVNVVVLEVIKPLHAEEIQTPFLEKNRELADRAPALYRTAIGRNGSAESTAVPS
jgi:hypothetical protein